VVSFIVLVFASWCVGEGEQNQKNQEKFINH
jgi:hypothetical protein